MPYLRHAGSQAAWGHELAPGELLARARRLLHTLLFVRTVTSAFA